MAVIPIKKKDVWKIEGEGFNRVKSALRKKEAFFKKLSEKADILKKEADDYNEEFLKLLAKEAGTKYKPNLRLDAEYEELGFYVLRPEAEFTLRDLLQGLKHGE